MDPCYGRLNLQSLNHTKNLLCSQKLGGLRLRISEIKTFYGKMIKGLV